MIDDIPLSLAVKLGSIARHAEEAISREGHWLDLAAAENLLGDEEVQEWMAHMDEMALLPVKR